MLADFDLVEIDRLNRVVEEEHARLDSLLQMLSIVGVDVLLDEGAITVINYALEAPCPIRLGPGYTGLGAGGT